MRRAFTAMTLAGAAAACVVACSVFGGENDPSSGGPEPPADAAAADGSAFDGSPRPPCPVTCDRQCDGAGVCQPFDFARDQAGTLGVPFALHLDDDGVLYIGKGHATDGGILRCAMSDMPGATCSPQNIFKRNDLVAMYIGDRFYWATDKASEFGSAARDGLDVRTATSSFTAKAIVGDKNTIVGVGVDETIFYCPVGSSCSAPDPNLTSATSVGGFKGDYCAAATRPGPAGRGIECSSTAGGGVQSRVAADPGMLGSVVLTAKHVFWRSGNDIRSADRGVGVIALLPVTLSDVGPGPFTAEGDTVYYAAGDTIFYAPRSGTSAAAVKVATAGAVIRALALSPTYVYFAYGTGASSGISRVPR